MNIHQLGNIYIPIKLLDVNPKLTADMFRSLECVVVRAEMDYATLTIKYTVICAQCKEIPPHTEPGPYSLELCIKGRSFRAGEFLSVRLVEGAENKYTMEWEEEAEDTDLRSEMSEAVEERQEETEKDSPPEPALSP